VTLRRVWLSFEGRTQNLSLVAYISPCDAPPAMPRPTAGSGDAPEI
jgi:hypothetical protein